MKIFLWIPRTSGQTIRNLVEGQGRNYSMIGKLQKKVMYCCRDGNSLDPVDYAQGHVPYGFHKHFGVDKCDYFTILRDPISRWISLFNHTVPKGLNKNIEPVWKKCNQNIELFLEACLDLDMNANISTKMIAGTEDMNNVVQDLKNYAYLWSRRKVKPTDTEMKEFYSQAKNNIDTGFKKVLFLENTPKDYQNLCDIMKWKYFDQGRKINSSSKSINIDWKDAKINSLLLELNKFDIQLYQHAKSVHWK